jgi:hypothetical protein
MTGLRARSWVGSRRLSNTSHDDQGHTASRSVHAKRRRVHAKRSRSISAIVAMTAVLIGFPVIATVGLSSVPSAQATTIPSSQGTDFWVSFESNCTFDGCGTPSGPGNLYLFISGSTATTGTVTDGAIGFSKTFSVTPGVVTSIQVPSTAENDTSDSVVANGAVHITASAPVSAYGLNTLEYTTDGYLGLPTSILGNSYLVEGYGGGFGSQFEVVGTQNDTTVTITPSEDVGSYTEGTPYTETLNQGDEYQLVDQAGGDLSGTIITSSAPVAVFAGNDCADVPPDYGYCNTLAEEMTPTDTWGTSFLTEPLATRTGDTFRFMASKNDTTVDIDGSAVSTLNAGQFYETVLTSASSVTANNPIQVMQYSNGETYDNADADPMDITIPPTGQFLNSYTVTTEPDGADPAITQNYLNIVAPTAETSSIELDGTDLPSSDFTPIAGSSYSGAQIAVGFGDHNVSASLPFGLTVYGFGGYDAYGYPGGFTLSPIATVTKVTLAPTTSTYTVGSSACETATVTDQNGDPVSGVRVNFTVTGVNPTAGFAYTSSAGTAQYCYIGTTTGTDTEGAAVETVTSNSATIKWTPKVTKNTDAVVLNFGSAPTYGPQSPVAPGNRESLEANVDPNGVKDPGSGVTAPTGTITFYDGATQIAKVSTSAYEGSAFAADFTSSLPPGNNEITAYYSGDANYPAETSNQVQITVAAGAKSTATATPTTVGLNFGSAPTYTEQSPVGAGNREILTATVTVNGVVNPGGSVKAPTGTVVFYNGSTIIGSTTLTSYEGSGYASLSTTALPPGSNEITAVYGGDLTHPASTSNQVQVTVS